MKIKLKVLSPIHIGSGEEIAPTEYFIDYANLRFNRLNMNSLFHDEKFKPFRERFINEAAKNRYIGNIIGDQSLLNRHILYSIKISPTARQHVIYNKTNVKAFIKSAGRVYIPGSSIKGAVLSAIFWYVLKLNYNAQNESRKEQIQSYLKAKIRESSRAYDDLLKITFPWIIERKSAQENPKFTHWLDFSDSNLFLPQESLELSLAKVKGARRGGELPILYECLKEDLVFEVEITRKNIKFNEEDILKIAHNFYLKVADKDGIQLPQEPYLLRLGQGSTAFSTSLLILSEELGISGYSIRAPRTRKRIDENIPMGFVQISLQTF